MKIGKVVVVGGAVAGSESASILAQYGYPVVVMEKGKLPYGKIEDGLPKWHVSLRNKNEEEINRKLKHPLIMFIPEVEVGKDIPIRDLIEKWHFDVVILAFGAYRDRPLNIKGIDKYLGKKIFYQNQFVYYFNHCHESDFKGEKIPFLDGAIVVGGGLASIDVVKILMIENVKRVLEEKYNIKTSIFELEASIADFLAKHQIKYEELGLRGVVLTYRRRISDMPITPKPDPAARIRFAKILQEKYLFTIRECLTPLEVIERDGDFAGIRFVENIIDENGNITPTNKFVDIYGSMAVSSIGSIPVLYEGLPSKGETYDYDPITHRINTDIPVFLVGNAATGKGNILASKNHAKEITTKFVIKHLEERGLSPLPPENRNTPFWDTSSPFLDEANRSFLTWAIQHLNKISFTTYDEWIKKNLPVRLEDIS